VERQAAEEHLVLQKWQFKTPSSDRREIEGLIATLQGWLRKLQQALSIILEEHTLRRPAADMGTGTYRKNYKSSISDMYLWEGWV
jgi:hypothetical protein